MKSIILIAPPAAGKGTQSAMICEKYKIPHISTGDILRAATESNHELGPLIHEQMKQGLLVGDDIIETLLKERIQLSDCQNGYILDGFPRTIEQATYYDKIRKELNHDLIVITLDISKEQAMQRILGRITCLECGAIYNTELVESAPKEMGKCDKCQSPLSKREDDNEQTFQTRYDTYIKETAPLIEYYQKQDLLYHVDSGMNKNTTFQQIEQILSGGAK